MAESSISLAEDVTPFAESSTSDLGLRVIPLAPPEDGQSFESLKDVVLRINEHAGPRGYAVVLARTKKSKLGVTRKAWLICDRGRKTREPRGQNRRHTSSRLNECPFSVIAKRDQDIDGWIIEVINPDHNHSATLAGAHPALRKLAMTPEVKDEISRALTVQIQPSKIISSLRVPDPVTGVNFDDPSDPVIVNPMFKPRDIYNMKAHIRREILGPLTPVQALIRELDQGDWFYELQKDDLDHITHLFFVKGTSKKMLKWNHEVLVIDCTYKTNRYRMPLLVISGQTALTTNFYVAFCFTAKETHSDYHWILTQLNTLYLQLELPSPLVIVTDMEKGLISAIEMVFPDTNHLLCIWHINNNVLVNCKREFDTKEEWDAFFTAWKSVIYAPSEDIFWESWGQFSLKYRSTHDDCVDYLLSTYITDYRQQFVRCYTDQVLHFNTTVTSRAEGGHAVLKRQLGTSTGDLKTVVDGINLMLMNEYQNHLINFDEAKSRLPMELKKPIFQRLIGNVTPAAMRKILPQYQQLVGQPTALSPCTGAFTTSMGLPCSHKIQDRLYSEGSLLIEDVHPHWR